MSRPNPRPSVRRDALTKVVKWMFGLLALAFFFVLFRSLSGPSLVSDPARVFDNVEIGQTALRRSAQTRVWVTRLSAAQRAQANELDPFMLDPNSGCAVDAPLCALSVKTARDGIEIMFTESVPAQLNSRIAWFGGFVDPISGGVYDRLGRAYKLESQRGPQPASSNGLLVVLGK